MALTRLAFTFDAGSFAVLKAFLESEGVPVLDLARGGHVAIAGADQGFYVEILAEDRPRAERLLRDNGFAHHLVPEKPT